VTWPQRHDLRLRRQGASLQRGNLDKATVRSQVTSRLLRRELASTVGLPRLVSTLISEVALEFQKVTGHFVQRLLDVIAALTASCTTC
jgi:hypothetical protein